MSQISAATVKALREETGLPMMECKTALVEADGDPELAKVNLQKKLKGKLESKAARETAEGRIGVFVSDDKKIGSLVELRCETAPVAKNEIFVNLSDTAAQTVANQGEPAPASETVLSAPTTGGKTIKDMVEDAFSLLRENMKIHAARKVTGEFVASYLHFDGKIGVVLALDNAPADEQVARDLCMHAAFTRPLAITREQIDPAKIEDIRKLSAEIAKDEGKPEQIIEKIVQGKVNAYCAENALMEQEHVKVPKTKVADVLKQAGVSAVTDLAILQVGG